MQCFVCPVEGAITLLELWQALLIPDCVSGTNTLEFLSAQGEQSPTQTLFLNYRN